ncbi:VC0807 family protein [Actinocorallia sp. A-T 12471]|uniref:VC0807 family protein n=1 Tax=Actinocorallia sp. A-T 12471 TaxID=3089813 RepID=UPI0029CB6493|nr:VC0807 family protein [Actinocorallia sp. A-T 12471]MDX6740510.1 VC0807 family protein [Actinocorallia sp. A-T 12471]
MGEEHRLGFVLPPLPQLLRHAAPRFVEGVIAPVAVFYLALLVLGQTGAVITAVVWVFAAIAWRAGRRQAVPGTLFLAAIGVCARAALAFGTGDPRLFFLQPTLGTLAVGAVFLCSVPLGRPMAQKVASDLVPLPPEFLAHAGVRRFFLRISLLWALVFFTNAVFSLWLLFHESLQTFLLLRTSVVALLWVAAAAVSIAGFQRIVTSVTGASTAAKGVALRAECS